MRRSRTSINLASDAAGRVDDAIEVPTCMDASSMDASRVDTSRLGSTGLDATTTEENPALTSSKLGETTCTNEYEDVVLDMIPKKMERSKRLGLSF
jgi:hypothetical protein